MEEKLIAQQRIFNLAKIKHLRCSNCAYWTKRTKRMGECGYWKRVVELQTERCNSTVMVRTHRKGLCEQWYFRDEEEDETKI